MLELESYMIDAPPFVPAQSPPCKLNMIGFGQAPMPGYLPIRDVPFVTGLSDDFLERRYGRNWAGRVV